MFFQKKECHINELSLKLISLHIPKTAGTSFRNILINNYSAKGVTQFDISPTGEFIINGVVKKQPLVPATTQVLHGHFEYKTFIEKFPDLKKIPLVTWLRNPTSRVVSNYLYLNEQMKKEISTNALALSLFDRLKCSLEEFSAKEEQRNKMSKFLNGLNLSDAFFIGCVEQYEHDVQLLAQKLNWNNKQSLEYNKTTSNTVKTFSEDTLALIQRNNEIDFSIYNSLFNPTK